MSTMKATIEGGEGEIIIPYLFGGLGLLMGLIAIALITLACSSRNKPRPPLLPIATVTDNQSKVPDVPRIVVIMAGDDKPTYLASAAPVNPHPAADSPV